MTLLTTAPLKSQTYHSVESNSEVHVVIVKKGIGVLVLSHIGRQKRFSK